MEPSPQTAGARLPDRHRARAATAAAALGTALALAALAPPAASAADACPNAEVRARQNGALLPDCRAYELVSPQVKHGNEVFPGRAMVPGPGLVQFRGAGAFGDAVSTVGAAFVARRGEDAWRSHAILPPMLGARLPSSSDTPDVMAVTSDFGSSILTSQYPYFRDDVGSRTANPFTTADVFHLDGAGRLTWLSRSARLPDASREDVQFIAADEQLDRVLLRTRRMLDPVVRSESASQLYVSVGGGQGQLVSALPDGRPSAGVGQLTQAPPLVSADVSSVVFESDNRLFLRRDLDDPAARTVELLLGPDATACNSPDPVAIDAQASTLLVRCYASVLPGEPTSAAGLYRVDLDDPARTELVGVPGNSFALIAAADDLSRVWFSSDSEELPGGAGSLYLLRDGALDLVARPTGMLTTQFVEEVQLSADAGTLVFSSRARFGDVANGGLRQVYRHTVSDNQVTCLSCPRDGSEPTGMADIVPYGAYGTPLATSVNAVSADGRRVFLSSDSALVARDTNGTTDAYVVHDGVPHLLSSGSAQTPSVFAAASEDGSEVFFATAESLVPQDVDNGVSDLYVARVGGGFAVEDGVAECTTDCRGPLPLPPAPPAPGTSTFTGPGDPEDAPTPAVATVFSARPLGARARRSLMRRGRAALRVTVSHAGTVRAVVRARIGRRSVVVGTAQRRAAEGGSVRLVLRLSGRARRHLRRTGALRVTVRVTYSAGGGGPQQTSFVLRTGARRGARR